MSTAGERFFAFISTHEQSVDDLERFQPLTFKDLWIEYHRDKPDCAWEDDLKDYGDQWNKVHFRPHGSEKELTDWLALQLPVPLKKSASH